MARLVLAAAGVPFKDTRITRAEWAKLKESTPYGKVPVLYVREPTATRTTVIPQSCAIVRFLARRFGLAPSDLVELALVEATEEQVGDLWTQAFKVRTAPTAPSADRLAAAAAYVSDILPRFVAQIEAQLADRDFVCGDTLTYADIYLLRTFDREDASWLAPTLADFHERHPKFHAYLERVASNPRIAAYLAQRAKTDF